MVYVILAGMKYIAKMLQKNQGVLGMEMSSFVQVFILYRNYYKYTKNYNNKIDTCDNDCSSCATEDKCTGNYWGQCAWVNDECVSKIIF